MVPSTSIAMHKYNKSNVVSNACSRWSRVWLGHAHGVQRSCHVIQMGALQLMKLQANWCVHCCQSCHSIRAAADDEHMFSHSIHLDGGWVATTTCDSALLFGCWQRWGPLYVLRTRGAAALRTHQQASVAVRRHRPQPRQNSFPGAGCAMPRGNAHVDGSQGRRSTLRCLLCSSWQRLHMWVEPQQNQLATLQQYLCSRRSAACKLYERLRGILQWIAVLTMTWSTACVLVQAATTKKSDKGACASCICSRRSCAINTSTALPTCTCIQCTGSHAPDMQRRTPARSTPHTATQTGPLLLQPLPLLPPLPRHSHVHPQSMAACTWRIQKRETCAGHSPLDGHHRGRLAAAAALSVQGPLSAGASC